MSHVWFFQYLLVLKNLTVENYRIYISIKYISFLCEICFINLLESDYRLFYVDSMGANTSSDRQIDNQVVLFSSHCGSQAKRLAKPLRGMRP